MEALQIIGVLASIALLIVGAWLLCTLIHDEGYKDGQVDAINGKIVYKLVEFADGTREYYKECELKDLIEEHKIIEK